MTKATGPLYRVHFRRRREGRTDYQKRLSLLKSGKNRLVVRKTNRFLIAQVVRYQGKGDVVLASANSKQLSTLGFKGNSNTPSAYLTGMLLGKTAISKGITHVVLDIGLHSPSHGSVVFACLKGALDAGLLAPHSTDAFPDQERLLGGHVKNKDAVLAAKQKILS